MQPLKVSTPEDIPFPLYNSTTGALEPGRNADISIYILKSGGNVGPTVGGTHAEKTGSFGGIYNYVPSAADINTEGQFLAFAVCSGCDTAVIQCNIGPAKIGVVGRFETAAYPYIGISEVGSPTSTAGANFLINTASTLADDSCIGGTIAIISGPGRGMAREIEDHDAALHKFFVKPWVVGQEPTTASVYIILMTPPAQTTPQDVNLVSIKGVAIATGRDICASVLLSYGAGPGQLDVVSGKVNINNTIPTPPTVAQIRTEIEIAGGSLALVKIAADAIKIQTDKMAFTSAGYIDSNALKMNSVVIQGTGTALDKWRG